MDNRFVWGIGGVIAGALITVVLFAAAGMLHRHCDVLFATYVC